jgi:hypothetical protein
METTMSCSAIGSGWREAAAGENGGSRYTHRSGRWRGFEIAAMVLGFVLFWPVGLAILFWIIWNKQHGRTVSAPAWMPRLGPLAHATNNSAFEDWKRAELERLEEERRKLATAQQEFEDFLGQLKRAKDREEFDGFMAGRAKPAGA